MLIMFLIAVCFMELRHYIIKYRAIDDILLEVDRISNNFNLNAENEIEALIENNISYSKHTLITALTYLRNYSVANKIKSDKDK